MLRYGVLKLKIFVFNCSYFHTVLLLLFFVFFFLKNDVVQLDICIKQVFCKKKKTQKWIY